MLEDVYPEPIDSRAGIDWMYNILYHKGVSTLMGEHDVSYPVLLRLPSGPLSRGKALVIKILLAISPKPYCLMVGNKIPKGKSGVYHS